MLCRRPPRLRLIEELLAGGQGAVVVWRDRGGHRWHSTRGGGACGVAGLAEIGHRSRGSRCRLGHARRRLRRRGGAASTAGFSRVTSRCRGSSPRPTTTRMRPIG